LNECWERVVFVQFPNMKNSKLFVALFSTIVLAVSFSFAEPAKSPAPAGKKGGCCVKAEKGGAACTHACCVEATKAGKNCEKCGGTNEKKS